VRHCAFENCYPFLSSFPFLALLGRLCKVPSGISYTGRDAGVECRIGDHFLSCPDGPSSSSSSA